MTFATSDAFTGRFGQPAHSRIALALSHVISDSQIRPQVVSFGSDEIKVTAVEDYFATLLKEPGCQKAWADYTNTKDPAGFPQQLAKGTAPLNGFRHYTLQDAIYLDYYVRVRMAAIGTWDSNVSLDELKAFVVKIPSSLAYAENTLHVGQSQLGVPTTDVNNEKKSQQLENSVRHYEKVIAADVNDKQKPNSWLDIYFALLPCIKGYYEIAKALLQDPTTNRNTLYYSLWIVPNADDSCVKKYDEFITKHIGDKPTTEQWKHWGEIFKESCDNERKFFDLAIKEYLQYDIVNTKTAYTISPYVKATAFLAPDTQSGVTISSTPEKWTLTNSKDGYSIKSSANKYLVVDNQQKVILSSTDSTKWSINPVFIPEKKTYQLFFSGVKLALDTDGTKVSVAKNDPTTQTWILT